MLWLQIIIFVMTLSLPVEAAVFGETTDLSLTIHGAMDDGHYHAGDEITIGLGKKNPMDTGQLAKIWFQVGLQEFQISHPPFQVVCRIPDEEIGELKIYALAESRDRTRSEIETSIMVEFKEPLVEIKLIDPDRDMTLEGIKTTHQLHLRGVYNDGARRSISPSDYGTVYASTNPGVVTVDKDGLVKTEGFGEAEIVVNNGTFEVRSRIKVIPYK